MYFNGCLNYPNFQYSVTTNGSYTLEFWIKLDRLNEFCKTPEFYSKKYYFIADPHIIYAEPISLTSVTSTNQTFNKNFGYNIYYQLLTSLNYKIQLTNFSQFNWNHVLIHFDSVKRNFKVVTNFNYYTPSFQLINANSAINFTLQKLVFCSNNAFCSAASNKEYLTNIVWGAAFYKDIRISDGTNWNFFNSQEYQSGT